MEATMRIRYDPTLDALYIRFKEGQIQDSDEVADGVILDVDADGGPMGLEILDASRILGGKKVNVELSITDGIRDA
jgi:uncharacterized protein YuzE